MTENKRFTIDDESDIIEFDWHNNEYIADYMWGDGKSWDRLCNRLNELNDENTRLKDEVYDWKASAEDYLQLGKVLQKENKELKKTVNYFAEICACSIETLNEDERLKKEHSAIICTEMQKLLKENKELKEENEQLKSQIEHLKIKMNRERNATTKQHRKWDKEVHEQLSEQATQIGFLKDENRHMKSVLEENRELKKLLKKISNPNGEIWLDNGQIIRLKKIINGEWVND